MLHAGHALANLYAPIHKFQVVVVTGTLQIPGLDLDDVSEWEISRLLRQH